MKKGKVGQSKPPVSGTKEVPGIDRKFDSKSAPPLPGLWKEDVSPSLKRDVPALETETPATQAVGARMVEDQSKLSMKAKVEPIHSSVSAEDLRNTIPARRHLMVPINVQALVIPPAPVGKQQRSKNQKTSPKEKHDLSNQTVNYGQRAPLKSEMRTIPPVETPGIEHEEGKSGWGLPEPFNYQSASPHSTGLKEGIHLFWTLPKALLQGELKDQEASVQNEYNSPEDLVPERYIPADEGFEHPITFEQAVEHRVEFTTEESPDGTLRDTLQFGLLPDRWIVVRLGSSPALKAWVIESSTLEVTPLAGYAPKATDSNIPEMTAIGPNEGDIYWTATYDNAKNRFTFHDIPASGEQGPFDYIVCGWYSDPQKDPAFMPETASEEDWCAFIRDNLGWNVRRGDVDDDWSLYLPAMTLPMGVEL
jgi:hypothetical protein